MKLKNKWILVMILSVSCFGMTAYSQDSAQRERFLKMSVGAGLLTEVQKTTILKNWDVLEKIGEKAELRLTKYYYNNGKGDIVDETITDYLADLGNHYVVSGSFSLNNDGTAVTIKIKETKESTLSMQQRKALLSFFSKGLRISDIDSEKILARWEKVTEYPFSFSWKLATESTPSKKK